MTTMPSGEHDQPDAGRALSEWREHEAVRPLVEEFERQALIRSVAAPALLASGVPLDAITEWARTAREPDHRTMVGAAEPAWIAVALIALSWHYPDMSVRDAARWAVMCDRLGVELFDTLDSWADLAPEFGWAYLAAGMTPGEVADRLRKQGRPDLQAVRAMAALRGVVVPVGWVAPEPTAGSSSGS